MKTFLLMATLFIEANMGMAQGAHNTKFNPRADGFQFVNSFTNNFIDVAGVKITTGGLCGGMSYSALDYFLKKITIPKQTYMPADHTMLHDYIYNRDVSSVADNIDKWTELTVNPFGWRTDEFFNWGLQGTNGGRLQELKSFIDRDMPVPIGLEAVGSGGLGANHQVLAIGYDCGRYQGTGGAFQEDFKLYCYNPNYPNEICTLVPNTKDHYYYWKEHPDDHHYITYFVDKKYALQTPPPDPTLQTNLSDCQVHELIIKFSTGSDDLRGGDDNCNLSINGPGGIIQQFLNVNNGARWIDNTDNTIELFLNNPITVDKLSSIRVFTKSCSGSCDNWNLNNIVVTARGGFADRVILNQSGNPLMRFTGSSFSQVYNFTNNSPCGSSSNVIPPVRGQLTNKLLITFTTGDDDLRGGNDNLNLVVHFRDNSTQTFNNVNSSSNWSNNSSHAVSLTLNRSVPPTDIKSIDMITNRCNGMGCDNWNFQGISIRAEGNNLDKVIYSKTANPIYRFTGSNFRYSVMIQ